MRGDLSTWVADALATPCNSTLSGNGQPSYWKFSGRKNVDGAIHSQGGPEFKRLLSQHAKLEKLPLRPGKVVISPSAGELKARWVLNCIVPDGLYGSGTAMKLRETVSAAVTAAESVGATSLALPALGCGVMGFQPAVAIHSIFSVASDWLSRTKSSGEGVLERVDVVIFAADVWHCAPVCASKLLGQPDCKSEEELVWREHIT